MSAPSLHPGAALAFLLVMWGLAGTLDQPLADEDTRAATPRRAEPVVRLLCTADPFQARPPAVARASYIASTIGPAGTPKGMPLFLHCVIDERKTS